MKAGAPEGDAVRLRSKLGRGLPRSSGPRATDGLEPDPALLPGRWAPAGAAIGGRGEEATGKGRGDTAAGPATGALRGGAGEDTVIGGGATGFTAGAGSVALGAGCAATVASTFGGASTAFAAAAA